MASMARGVFMHRVERFRGGSGGGGDDLLNGVPYRVDGDNSMDAEVGRLADMRAESEATALKKACHSCDCPFIENTIFEIIQKNRRIHQEISHFSFLYITVFTLIRITCRKEKNHYSFFFGY